MITSIALAGIYLAARLGSQSIGDVLGTLNVALAAGTLAGLYAVVQAVGLDPIRWSRTSMFGGLLVRPFGSLGHPNLLGLVSGAAAAAALALTLLHPGRRVRYAVAWLVSLVATVLSL